MVYRRKRYFKLPVRQIGNVKGNWDVSFPVTRVVLTELTRIVLVNHNIAIPNGILSIEELVRGRYYLYALSFAILILIHSLDTPYLPPHPQ